MKKALLAILLLSSLLAAGQNTRWDNLASTTTGVGQMLPVLALPGASIAFYTGCTTLPCATPAVTYESASSGTACPSDAQVVWQLPIAQGCVGVADSQGNFGGWFQPGVYQYVITVSGHASGPYAFNVAGAGGGVTSIAAGTGTQVSPSSGTGSITVSASPNAYLRTTLSGNIGPTDTTIPLTSVSGLTSSGEIIIGSEWITYTGISGNSLTGAGRGNHGTTASSASSGTDVFSVLVDFSNPSQAVSNAIVSNGGSSPTLPFFGCATPDQGNNALIQFGCPGSSETFLDTAGAIKQTMGDDENIFESETGIGPGGGFAQIVNSGYLFDSMRQNQSAVPQGFGAGLAGPVESIAPQTIAAPTLTCFIPAGATTYSFEVTGTDIDGNTIPGTVASCTGPAIFSGEIVITGPFTAGVANFTVWETAGPPGTGSVGSYSTQGAAVEYFGTTPTPGTPPATNTSIPKVCVSGSEVSCWITTASAPTGSCINGWFDTNQSGSPATLYQCVGGTWIEGTGSGGIASINGSTSSAQTLAASGTGLSVATVGSTTTYTLAGGAGTGAVQAGTQYQDVTYPSTGSTTTVGPLTNEQTLPTGLSTSQINSALGTAHIATTLQAGAPPVPFANTNHNPIHDDNDVVPEGSWNMRASGAVCDAQVITASITQGSTTITSGAIFTAAISDGATWVETVGLDPSTNEPIRFDATLTYVNSTTATLSTPAPFTSTSGYFVFGHQDNAAIADAIDVGIANGRQVDLPNGICWTSVPQRFGANIVGQGSITAGVAQGSVVLGSAGEDVFQSSVALGAAPAGLNTGNYTITLAPGIDATKAWEICGPTSSCTQQTPLYRPIGILGPDAQDPLAPQWIEGPTTTPYRNGATNGVATMTNGSAVACVPSSEALPAVGQQIVFPYQAVGTAMFETTVSSLSGAGCAGGTSPMTLAASWAPATPAAPVEWFSGVSFQNTLTAISSGTTIDAANPLTIDLANPIIPSPAGVAGVAPFGYIQIDGEQFSYYGNSNYLPSAASVSTPSITLYSRAQNGTTAATHSTGAIIVPLNPFEPSWPWPVTPTITSNVQTPANAEFFPAQSVGNAAISFPVPDGNDYSSAIALSSAKVHDILINIGGGLPASSADGDQIQNDTAAMYIAVQPFTSTISNITIRNTFYGIVEGTPSINTNKYFTNGFPTADGNHWINILDQSSALPMDLISEGSGMFSGLTFFSQSFAPPNNYIPGFVPGTDSGSQGNLMLDSPFDDQSSGYPYFNTGVQFTTFQFKYLEAETGFFNQTQPLDFWNCLYCTWLNPTPKSGGVRFIAGNYQQFYGGTLGADSTNPIIILGNNINFDHVIGMGNSALGSTYGTNGVINFGMNNTAVGGGDNVAGTPTGPNVPQMQSDALAPVTGQTDETLRTGNTTVPYVANGLAYFNPFQLQPNSEDSSTMTGPWVFDPTSPLSRSYTTCAQSAGMGCNPVHMLGDYIYIGSGQRIAPTKYYGHISLKFPNGSGRTFDLSLLAGSNGACSGAAVYTAAITATDSNWHDYPISLADFTNYAGCTFNPIFNSDGVHAFDVQFGYLDLIPLPNSMMLPVATPTEGSACTLPGSFLGSDASYIYVCASGGTVKRVGIS